MPMFKQTLGGNLKYKPDAAYMLSQYELNRLKAMSFDNLLDIETQKNGELTYSVSGLKTLSQEISTGMNKSMLASIVSQTFQLAGLLNRIGLSVRRTILSPDFIYFDHKTEQFKFIYLPVNGELLGYDEVLFVRDMVFQARLGGNDRIEWTEWAERLTHKSSYEEDLRSLPSAEEDARPKKVQRNEPIDDEAETSLGGGPDDVEDVWGSSGDMHETFDDDDEAPTGIDDAQRLDAMDKSDGTFFESRSEIVGGKVTAKLISMVKDEEIDINNKWFKLGRSAQRADYCISNNSVSNVHAIITQKKNQFFLKDNHSTNGTYLDGVKLDPNDEPVMLSNGSIIRLWKLEYKFVLM